MKASSVPHSETQFYFDHPHKIKSISMLTLKTIEFRPAYKYQVNFDLPHIYQINFTPTLKSSRVPSVTQKSSRFWSPHKNKSISIPTQKPSKICPPHKNQEFQPERTNIWKMHLFCRAGTTHLFHKHRATVSCNLGVSIPVNLLE